MLTAGFPASLQLRRKVSPSVRRFVVRIMSRADSETDTAASEQEVQQQGPDLKLVSDAQLVVHDNDEQIRAAGSRVSEDLCQIDLTSTLQKADKMFSSMMDPNNEDTKKLVESLFHDPMKQITQKALETIQALDLRNAEEAKVQMETVSKFLKLQAEVRESALDHVYEAMQRQIDHFSMSVDTYNLKMKETVEQTLELYQKRINTEILVRQQVLTQKKAEHAAMLEAHAEEAKVKAQAMTTVSKVQTEVSARKLQQQKAKDERLHDKEMKALERLSMKMNQELQRDLNDLETKARRGKIGQDERAAINSELKIELDRRGAVAAAGCVSNMIGHSFSVLDDWSPSERWSLESIMSRPHRQVSFATLQSSNGLSSVELLGIRMCCSFHAKSLSPGDLGLLLLPVLPQVQPRVRIGQDGDGRCFDEGPCLPHREHCPED